MSPYRNFLDEARDKLARARSALGARASSLGPLRPLLPRGIRRSLARLERAIERPVGNVRDVEVAERSLAEYEEQLEVAIAFSDHQARDRAARWQKQRRWFVWAMAIAGAFALFVVVMVVESVEQDATWACALGPCNIAGGTCTLPAAGEAAAPTSYRTPASDAVCAASLECKEEGACALHGGVCGPSSEEHCAQSKACAERGVCSLVDNQCVSLTAGNPCGLSAECAQHGRCATGANGCTANNDEDCRTSWDCRIDGQCQLVNGRCAAATDQDCQAARKCTPGGVCKAYSGECLFTSDPGASSNLRE